MIMSFSDVPQIPAKLTFTNVNFLLASHLFAVEASLKRKNRCECHLATNYTSEYQMFGCLSSDTKLLSGKLNCMLLNDTDRVDKDLVCIASNEGQILNLCLMPSIKDCMLNITLQGVNKLGNSLKLSVTTPRLKYTGKFVLHCDLTNVCKFLQ